MSDEAIKNLREHQTQLDAYGVRVGVSRQALGEALEHIAELAAEIKRLQELIRDEREQGQEYIRVNWLLQEDINALREQVAQKDTYMTEMVRLAAEKHRPAYDEQQKTIMELREQVAALKIEDENREVWYQAAIRNIERLQEQVARMEGAI